MEDRDLEFLFDSPEVIKLCLNCSKRECTNCLGQNPVVKKGPRKKIEHDKFMKLYEAEMSDREIAEKLGVNQDSIRAYRKKHDIPTKRPKNRFTDEQFIELYEKGLNDRQIAKELGLTQGYVCAHRNKLGLPTKYTPKRRVKNAERIR